VGVVVGHQDMLGSVGGLWDTPSSCLGSKTVVGVIGGHRDVLGSGGWLWDMPALRLGSRDVLSLTETCFGVGAGSGVRQPRIWDCGTSWVLLLVTKTC
jgi:hypothetical protein